MLRVTWSMQKSSTSQFLSIAHILCKNCFPLFPHILTDQKKNNEKTIYFLASAERRDVGAVFFSVDVNWLNSIDRMNKVHGNAGTL